MDAHQKRKNVQLGTLTIIDDYHKWLTTLNYSKGIVRDNPQYVEEFIEWSNINDLTQINNAILQEWFDHLSVRKHKQREGGLSGNTIKSYHSALNQFSRFLRETGRESFELKVNYKTLQAGTRQVLTRSQISRLYEATHHYPDPGHTDKGLLAARERVILGLYYGCGLRKSEGLHVALTDLDFRQNLVYVRKGKNYKERYVPIAEGVRKDFIHYLDYARPQLIRGKDHEVFLTGWYGDPLRKSALHHRLHVLCELAGLPPVGLHALRHSIATHLLQSGMKLEQITRFLGHSSLESTTIYTHISHEQI